MSENVSPAQVKDKITKAVQNGESPSTTIAKSSSTPLLNQLMKPAPKKKEGKKPEVSKYTRFATDMESFRDAIGALPSVYKFFWTIYRLNPLRTIIIMAVYITTGLTPALRLRTGGNFIKQLEAGIESRTLNTRTIFMLAITQAATYVIEQSLWSLLHNTKDKTQDKLAMELDVALMKAHLRLDVDQMNDKEIMEAFQRAQNTLSVKPNELLTRQLQFFQQLTSGIAEGITLFYMTPRRGWILIFLSVITPLLQSVVGNLVYEHYAHSDPEHDPEYNEQLSRAATMKYYAHSIGMRPELTLFGLKNWVVEQYTKASMAIAEMKEPTDPNRLPNKMWGWMNEFSQTACRTSMYLLVALRPGYFGIPLPELAYLEQNAQQLFLKIYGTWKRVGYVFHDMMAIQELFECMEMQPSLQPPEDPAEYESGSSSMGTGMKIECRNVSYKYPGKNEFVLKDVSFVLQAGETLALLGFNGSGKSTLIKLLTRLWDPTEGEILINDIDIKNYKQDDIYDKMSVLFQDYQKYTPLNVAENIATGDISNYTESLITQAAEGGDADSFIQKLPKQYQSKLRDGERDLRLHRGLRGLAPRHLIRHIINCKRNPVADGDPTAPVELSSGQWQRLALSRAFMRAESADLLILDEPSSSLDPEAEHKLFRYIQQVRRNRTTIYVTHRFYTVRMATKIAFLEEGRLIEWGSHDELMGISGGKYSKLYQLQSEGFSSLGQLEETQNNEYKALERHY